MSWQLQDAKKHFSRLVQLAMSEGRQKITRRGKPTVVVVSAEQHNRGIGKEQLSRVLRDCPVKGWKIARSRDTGHTFDLC
jgi:antitoxin Phd